MSQFDLGYLQNFL